MPVHDEQDLVEALQTKLKAAVWPGTSTEIFAAESVVISAAVPMEVIQTIRLPAVFLKPMAGQADIDEPLLGEMQIAATVVVMGAGDTTGEYSLVGAHKRDDKGLLGVSKEVVRNIGKLSKEDSIPIVCTWRSSPQAMFDDRSRYIAYRDLLFRAMVSFAYET